MTANREQSTGGNGSVVMGAVLTAFALLALVMMCSCGNANVDQKSANVESHSTTSASNLTKEEVEEPTYAIETDYGELVYPKQWEDQVRIEQKDGAVTFYGTVGDEKEVTLFSLTFGVAPAEGSYLGELNGKEVYIVDSPLGFDDSWDGEEKEAALAMQDGVNVVIQGLRDSGLATA